MLASMVTPSAAAVPDDSFRPNVGASPVSYGDLIASGVVHGRTGRLLVRADNTASLADLPQIKTVIQLPGGVLRVTPADGVDDLALARLLADRAGVRWAVPDLVLRLSPSLPDDPWVGDEWHLENTGQGGRPVDVDIDAGLAWEFATGAGQTIAILDSGVQTNHPDLSVISGHDYIDRDDDSNPASDDAAPHGTGTAGIAAARGDNGIGVAGVAYDADIYAIRLIGGNTTTEDLYNAFVEAVDAGATVLSNSWGFGTDCTPFPTYAVFDEMVGYAETEGRGGLGAVVVFAAGNGGCDASGDGILNQELVIGVAAIESSDVRAGYSNYGSTVDIGAPTGLLTTDITPGGYGSYGGDDGFYDGFSGTSGATPVVSGVVALMMEANPRITAAQVREVLCDTAVRNDIEHAGYDSDGWSPYYGCGRVDAGAAVAAVANGEPAAPAPAYVTDAPYASHVGIAWIPAEDPDGDVYTYEVVWSTSGADLATVTPVEVDGWALDLTDVTAIGDTVSWQVRARDPWGAGPFSAPVTFTVARAWQPVETPAGCAHRPFGGAVGIVLALAAAMVGGRRRETMHCGPPVTMEPRCA